MQLEKTTNESPAPRRQYNDACGMAHALDLIGERWAMLVMRELMLGSKRFSDLRADLPGISANVLTQRLEGLEAARIVVRRKLPPPASIQVYELTPWGLESEPILLSLGRWAARSPDHDPSLPLSGVSLMLSFKAMLHPVRAQDLVARVGFRLGRESYLARIANGQIDVARDALDEADVILTADVLAVAAAIYGGQPLDALVASGALTIEGDKTIAERFTTLFPLPEKAWQRD